MCNRERKKRKTMLKLNHLRKIITVSLIYDLQINITIYKIYTTKLIYHINKTYFITFAININGQNYHQALNLNYLKL